MLLGCRRTSVAGTARRDGPNGSRPEISRSIWMTYWSMRVRRAASARADAATAKSGAAPARDSAAWVGNPGRRQEMDAPTLTDSLARETAEVLAKLGVTPELVRDG